MLCRQFYQACKTGIMDQALSIYFLLGWLGGDLLNLIGSFLADQLPLQVLGLGWLSNTSAPGRREGLGAALSSTGSQRPKLPGMLPLQPPPEMLPSPILGLLPFPPRVWSFLSQGCSLFPLGGCSLLSQGYSFL